MFDYKHWKLVNQTLIFQINISRWKVTALGVMCGTGIWLEPYFSDKNVNEENYLEILNNLILPQLNKQFP